MTDTTRRDTEDLPDFPERPSELDPEDWRRRLDPEVFRITREGGTEPPFSGDYRDCRREGSYLCVCCGARLFDSRHKFDSGTGWPSFWRPVDPADVREAPDTSHGMRRTEVLCARCDAHLGHVFPDGPDPTGLRYCINSAALILEPRSGGHDQEGATGEEAGP